MLFFVKRIEIIFYSHLFHQIDEVRKELAGQFLLKPVFESTEGNFRFFSIIPEISDHSAIIDKMGNSWGHDWELWTKERVLKKWNPETLEIKTNKNNKNGEVEVRI